MAAAEQCTYRIGLALWHTHWQASCPADLRYRDAFTGMGERVQQQPASALLQARPLPELALGCCHRQAAQRLQGAQNGSQRVSLRAVARQYVPCSLCSGC